jgi:hypothetical protein
MAETIPPDEQSNYETFRECLSEPVLRALAAPVDKPKKKRRARHRKKDSKDSKVETPEKSATNGTSEAEGDQEANDAEDLGEFIDVSTSPLPSPYLAQISRLTTSPVPINPPLHLPPPAPPHPHALPLQILHPPTNHLLPPPLDHHSQPPPLNNLPPRHLKPRSLRPPALTL